jgi:hypothetical protein
MGDIWCGSVVVWFGRYLGAFKRASPFQTVHLSSGKALSRIKTGMSRKTLYKMIGSIQLPAP